MQLFLDAVQLPLPSWTAEMLSEHPPAKLADFAARFASELARNQSRWVTDISPDGDTLLSRVAVVNCKSLPISEVSHKLKAPVRDSLWGIRELHNRAADSIRGGHLKLAVEEIEAVQGHWNDVCASLDALSAMDRLTPVLNPDALERLLGALEANLGTDNEQAAKTLEELGVLAEQWAEALKGENVSMN